MRNLRTILMNKLLALRKRALVFSRKMSLGFLWQLTSMANAQLPITSSVSPWKSLQKVKPVFRSSFFRTVFTKEKKTAVSPVNISHFIRSAFLLQNGQQDIDYVVDFGRHLQRNDATRLGYAL